MIEGRSLRLGVNVDHVATIRNARGGLHPNPVRAARLAERAGADGITAHLREDRRHISDDDIAQLVREIRLPLNLEMAATDEMLEIALRHRPHAACLVPEKRNEVTTEGGLDVVAGAGQLGPVVRRLSEGGVRVALFVDPEIRQIDKAKELGAPAVELHTGAYCIAAEDIHDASRLALELGRIVAAARHAETLGLECHAGHGLSFDTVGQIAAIESIVELNIGHFLIGEAIFVGLERAIGRMRAVMMEARANARASGNVR